MECRHATSCQEATCESNVCVYTDVESDIPCCDSNEDCDDQLECTDDECVDTTCVNTNLCRDDNPCTDDLCTDDGCQFVYNGLCDACFDVANCTECLALEQCEWLLCPLLTDVDAMLPFEAAGSGLVVTNGTAQFNATFYNPNNISLVVTFNDTVPGHYVCSPRAYTGAENEFSTLLEETCPSVPCYDVSDDTDLIVAVTVTASVLLPVLLAVLGGVFILGAFLWRCRNARAGPLESLETFADFGTEGLSQNPLFVSGEIAVENAVFDADFDGLENLDLLAEP
jgi:hypothetical protein